MGDKGNRLAKVAVLVWVLWAQSHGMVVLNNKVMVDVPRDGMWRYVNAFDTKLQCSEALTKNLADQDGAIAALTPDSDLSKVIYREFKCFPSTIDPTDLTRGGGME